MFLEFDRLRVRRKSLRYRLNRFDARRDMVFPDQIPRSLSASEEVIFTELASRIRTAREAGNPVVLAFGAHAIKNGLGPILNALMEQGWLTHLATNGAGVIHDWEIAFAGATSEDVRQNVARGEFGNWEETGYYINLAINVGAFEGRGYGEAVGALIATDRLTIPTQAELSHIAQSLLDSEPEKAAAAADLLALLRSSGVQPGELSVPHPFRQFSVQAAAFRLGIPLTGHVMIGHDVIYTHPLNHGGLLGKAALRDFLRFAHTISRLEKGVYLSVGSAVMSPMIFEKSFSMAQNLALQKGHRIEDFFVVVVDLAPCSWDWTQGEPPQNDPAYYLRPNKTFSRMGGVVRYLQMDNRDFFLHLLHRLAE